MILHSSVEFMIKDKFTTGEMSNINLFRVLVYRKTQITHISRALYTKNGPRA